MSTSTAPEARPSISDSDRRLLRLASAFTHTYRQHLDSPVALREAHCLQAFFPAICQPIDKTDLFAGRKLYMPLVGFKMEHVANQGFEAMVKDTMPDDQLPESWRALRAAQGVSAGGFYYDYQRLDKLQQQLAPEDPDRAAIADLLAFWQTHHPRGIYNQRLPQDIKANLGRAENWDSHCTIGFFRVCCVSVDFDTLLQLGLPGLQKRITAKLQEAKAAGRDSSVHEGMLLALKVLASVCAHYAAEARQRLQDCSSEQRRQELLAMADALEQIQQHRPETLRQAIQLFWLYNLLTDTMNYGRMDIYLGDFFAGDIDAGRETPASAQQLVEGLWQMIGRLRYDGCNGANANCRLIVGGLGRRNEANADRFAFAAMDVTQKLRLPEPNLTLRFYQGQNRQLMERALDLIADGCVHPTLYNDDVHIPWVQKAFNVPLADAMQYIPQGCGELMIDHKSVGSPNNIINYVTLLDLVLHNGYDTQCHDIRGLRLGEPESFTTFQSLVDAFKQQVDFTHSILARRHAIEHAVHAQCNAFLFMSILTDDCIERGQTLFDGGTRYLGGLIETFGMTNVVDSLMAIKTLVFDRKVLTLRQFVEVLDANFEGREDVRQMALAAPKFGNDIVEVDALHTELSDFLCRSAYEKAEPNGLHFFLNCNLNPGGVSYSEQTKASPDGRQYSEPFAMGNAPTAGRDKAGLTAVLNSMSRHGKLHAGYVHNIKVAPALMAKEQRKRFEALLDTYFAQGGSQVMVTTLNQADLLDAVKHPERYPNLLVRVAGWTSRFVELDRRYQQEIIARTWHQ